MSNETLLLARQVNDCEHKYENHQDYGQAFHERPHSIPVSLADASENSLKHPSFSVIS
jgi:hypothetical protein